jgi:hypothetical protein
MICFPQHPFLSCWDDELYTNKAWLENGQIYNQENLFVYIICVQSLCAESYMTFVHWLQRSPLLQFIDK